MLYSPPTPRVGGESWMAVYPASATGRAWATVTGATMHQAQSTRRENGDMGPRDGVDGGRGPRLHRTTIPLVRRFQHAKWRRRDGEHVAPALQDHEAALRPRAA